MPAFSGAFAVDQHVVDEEAGLGGQADPVEGQRVDLRFGLAAADEAGVDDGLEDLVDRQHRAPQRLPLAHVVGQHRHPVAGPAFSSRISSIIGGFGSSASK